MKIEVYDWTFRQVSSDQAGNVRIDATMKLAHEIYEMLRLGQVLRSPDGNWWKVDFVGRSGIMKWTWVKVSMTKKTQVVMTGDYRHVHTVGKVRLWLKSVFNY